MEIKHLNTFLVLSKLNNFTKTAEHLAYAQSSITTQIQKLEEELHVHLFYKEINPNCSGSRNAYMFTGISGPSTRA